jgi:hypothetical protein
MAPRYSPTRPTTSPTTDSSSRRHPPLCPRASPSPGTFGLRLIQPTPSQAPCEHQDPLRPPLHRQRPTVHAPTVGSPLPELLPPWRAKSGVLLDLDVPQIESSCCTITLAPIPHCPHHRRPPESIGPPSSSHHGCLPCFTGGLPAHGAPAQLLGLSWKPAQVNS